MSWLLAALALLCTLALIRVGLGYVVLAFDRGRTVRLDAPAVSTLAREWAAHLLNSLWWPLGWVQLPPSAHGPTLDPEAPGPTPVLLLPGWGLNRASLGVLATYLRRRGWRWVWAVNLGPRRVAVPERARRLDALVDRLRAVSGSERVDVVAHGAGGVVAAHYLRHGPGGAKVRRLITVGAPFGGTRWAVFSGSAEARDLLPGSPTITGLGPLPVPAVALVCGEDTLLVPPKAGRPGWVEVVELPGVGHVEAMTNGRVLRALRDLLLRAEATP